MNLIKYALVILVMVWLFKAGVSKIGGEKLGTDGFKNWVTLASIQGTGDQTTMSIKSPKGESRIHWEAVNSWSEPASFSARIVRPDGRQLRNMASNIGVPGSGRKSDDYFLLNTPEYYIDVRSGVSWTITVEVPQ